MYVTVWVTDCSYCFQYITIGLTCILSRLAFYGHRQQFTLLLYCLALKKSEHFDQYLFVLMGKGNSLHYCVLLGLAL